MQDGVKAAVLVRGCSRVFGVAFGTTDDGLDGGPFSEIRSRQSDNITEGQWTYEDKSKGLFGHFFSAVNHKSTLFVSTQSRTVCWSHLVVNRSTKASPR